MKQQITAFLVDSDADSAKRIKQVLTGMEREVRLIGTARNLQEGMQAIQASNPHLVILEVSDLDRGTQEVEFLLSHSPQSTAFVSSPAISPEWILKLIRAGASEYLTRPVSPSELVDAVRKVVRSHNARRDVPGKKGEVISVYHPSGGVGTTSIAVNLAATLAAQGAATVLVDLNFSSSDVSAFLDLAPRYTLASMIPKGGQVDASFLKSILAPHPCGIHVLDGPDQVREAERITPELLEEVIGVLRTIFEYVVLDAGGELAGRNLAAFDLSDRILFVTVLSIPGLRTARRYLGALAGEGFGPDRVKLVVNRHQPKDRIKIPDAEKVLGIKTYHTLPNCFEELRTSIVRGAPLAVSVPKSSFSLSVGQLARQLCSDSDNRAGTAP